MSKTKTKTKKAVSKKAKKASAEAGTVTFGGREWKRGTFSAQCGTNRNSMMVDGYTCGRFGMFEIPQVVGMPWAHLFDLKMGGHLLGIFDGYQAAAIASHIEDALDRWPTTVNEFDGRSFRDEALWASGFQKGGSFCYKLIADVWWLEDEEVLRPSRLKAA